MLNVRCRRFRIPALFLMTLLSTPAVFAQTLYDFNLPAQALADSLRAIGQKTSVNILFDPQSVEKLLAPAVHGQYSASQAVGRVLAGTNLAAEQTETNTLLVEPKTKRDNKSADARTAVSPVADVHLAQATQISTDQSQRADVPAQSKEEPKKKEGLEEIVVTGTYIRGAAPPGSPLTFYSREYIDQSGASTLDQFARQMLENFSGADTIANVSSNIIYSRFNGGATNNTFAGAGFNLRGLGSSSTLTLLNGHRLAPAGLDGSLTDISQVPLSIVDHIEVLSDGASAVYGGDAVAGVVNIITRKDFDGAETGIRYGAATDGGANEITASQVFGKSWGTGNAALSYEYDKQGGLDTSERRYIGNQGGPDSLIPGNRRNSIFLSGSQRIGKDTTISADAIYSDRIFSSQSTTTNPDEMFGGISTGNAIQSGATLMVDRRLFGDWYVDLTGSYSKLRQSFANGTTYNEFGLPGTATQSIAANSEVAGVDLAANGSVFPIPGGTVKGALGASFRSEKFNSDASSDDSNFGPSSLVVPTAHRRVTSLYGEFFVPVVGDSNAIVGIRRLELSVSGRYDHYSDFGSTSNPKLGLLWEPVSGLRLKSSFGSSFKAPLLSQLSNPATYETVLLRDPMSSTGRTDTLFVGGGNLQLRPEKSHSFTTGFEVRPLPLPQFSFAASYFRIQYSDRIATPPLGSFLGILTDPSLASFIQRNPQLSDVQAAFDSPGFQGDLAGRGPAGVQAIFNDKVANIAVTKESGVDVAALYFVPTSFGRFDFALAADRLLKNSYQGSLATPAFDLLNTFGQTPKLRGRGSVAWTRGYYSAVISVNYINSYQNSVITPAEKIDSWTTADLRLTYKTDDVPTAYFLRNLTVALNVQNVADTMPPYVNLSSLLPTGQNPIPYDPANASPVGRLITLQLTKRWGR